MQQPATTKPVATLIDDRVRLVGGPDRPIPQPKDNTPASPGSNQSYADRANVAKDSLAGGANDLYNRLGSAVSERGQMLDGLEDTVNSLRTGSENMVAQVCCCWVPVLFFSLLMERIGKEACCRAVDARMVQLLTFSKQRLGLVGEWKDLRNGRLVFSRTFCEWTQE